MLGGSFWIALLRNTISTGLMLKNDWLLSGVWSDADYRLQYLVCICE